MDQLSLLWAALELHWKRRRNVPPRDSLAGRDNSVLKAAPGKQERINQSEGT